MKAAYRDATPQRSFRDYLTGELATRCARNPQYSLRAFANYLGVHHSTLSQMMRGKRTITREAVEKFGFRLGLTEQEVASWVETERSVTRNGLERRRQVNQLARDMAEVLEDWRNFAILELTRLKDFQADSRWIARMLGITVDEVNIALSRLCRLRLLEMTADGKWRDLLGDVVMDVDRFHEAAVARFVEQVRGDCSVATMAVPESLAPAAVERIARFRSEFLEWLESAPEKDEVYQLEIRFVPVTRRGH